MLCALSPLPFFALRKNCTENAPHPGKIRERWGFCPPFGTVWGYSSYKKLRWLSLLSARRAEPSAPVRADNPPPACHPTALTGGGRGVAVFLPSAGISFHPRGRSQSISWWGFVGMVGPCTGPHRPSPGAGMQSRCPAHCARLSCPAPERWHKEPPPQGPRYHPTSFL